MNKENEIKQISEEYEIKIKQVLYSEQGSRYSGESPNREAQA